MKRESAKIEIFSDISKDKFSFSILHLLFHIFKHDIFQIKNILINLNPTLDSLSR